MDGFRGGGVRVRVVVFVVGAVERVWRMEKGRDAEMSGLMRMFVGEVECAL